MEERAGSDKEIKWPTGTGGKGNDGVAAAVKQTEGAIGYVEQAYALQNDFTFADVKNSAGKYVAPTLESTSAAGEGVEVPADLGISVIDSPNPAAYPIASQTFAMAYADPCKAGLDQAKAAGLKKFLSYLVGDSGQATIQKLSYAKIPDDLDGARTLRRSTGCGATAARSPADERRCPARRAPAAQRPWRARIADPLFFGTLAVIAGLVLVLIVFFFIFLLDHARPRWLTRASSRSSSPTTGTRRSRSTVAGRWSRAR